jgi:hypothetical protein
MEPVSKAALVDADSPRCIEAFGDARTQHHHWTTVRVSACNAGSDISIIRDVGAVVAER